MVTRIPDVTVNIDFTAAAPHLHNLPVDMFDIDERDAFATVAALFSTPEVRSDDTHLSSEGTLAVRILALFAADAWLRFTKQDFRTLDGHAARLQSNSDDETASLIAWVRRGACKRAVWIGLIGDRVEPLPDRQNPLALIAPDKGRGYGVLDNGLATEFHGTTPPNRRLIIEGQSKTDEQVAWERKRLRTYAGLFAGCKPRCCNSAAEAVVFLALYGAGARVELTKQQFRKLERRVREYIGTMTGHERGIQRNADMASFAMHAAQERARAAGVI